MLSAFAALTHVPEKPSWSIWKDKELLERTSSGNNRSHDTPSQRTPQHIYYTPYKHTLPTLSTHPLNAAYQHPLSPPPITTGVTESHQQMQHILELERDVIRELRFLQELHCFPAAEIAMVAHPISTPYQHILSTYSINIPYQPTLSTHPINTPSHILSTYHINTSHQHTLSTHHTLSTQLIKTPYRHRHTPSVLGQKRNEAFQRTTRRYAQFHVNSVQVCLPISQYTRSIVTTNPSTHSLNTPWP